MVRHRKISHASLLAALMVVGVVMPAGAATSRTGRGHEAISSTERKGSGPARYYDRWKEKGAKRQLPPNLRSLLRRQDEKGRASLRDGLRRPWKGLVGRRPRPTAPEGSPPELVPLIDSVLAAWVVHYSSGLAPSTDGIMAVTADGSGNVYATGYTTGIFTGTDFLTVKYNSAGVRQWVATYNGPANDYDAAVALALDASGNVYVTGSSFGIDTEEDYATVKYSPSGQQLWAARYDGPALDYDAPSGIKLDGQNNVIVTGVSYGILTDGDYLTIKYNNSGVQLWTSRYDGSSGDFDSPVGLGVDISGSVYVSGTSIGLDSFEDYATVKISFAGDTVWTRRYDGPGNDYDVVSSMTVDFSGNTYITGTSYNENFDTDVATIKYDPFGRVDWINRYDSPDETDESGLALTIDALRNVYVAGTIFNFGAANDYLTIKYNSNGTVQWGGPKIYNGTGNGYDDATAIAVDAGGNIAVTGVSFGAGSYEDIATVKYNSSGGLLWIARYEGPAFDYDGALTAAFDAGGNVLVGGVSYGEVTDEDCILLKYNIFGAEQWAERYNGPGNSSDEAAAVALDASGNIYVTGTSYDLVTQSDYATVKYNAAGVQQWEARYNGTGDGEDFASALAVDASGNVLVTGTSLGATTGYDIATVKYTTNGVPLWVARYSGPGTLIDEGADVAVDASGNVYVTGVRTDAVSGPDYMTIKYQPTGLQSWAVPYDGPADSVDEAYAVAVDGSGNVYVTGSSYSDASKFDCTTLKYNSSGSQLWVGRYNGAASNIDRGFSLALDGSNVVVTGVTKGASTGFDILTVRYNSSGSQLWARTATGAGSEDDVGAVVRVGPGSAIYVGGTIRNPITGLDITTLKYNSSGTLQWTASYNSPENDDDVTTSLVLDAVGNVYTSGYSFMLTPGYDYATVKYSPDGKRHWWARFDDPAQLNDEPTGSVVDVSGNVYVAGFSETADGTVYTLVNYSTAAYAPSTTSLAFPSVNIGCRAHDTVVVRNPAAVNTLVVFSAVSTDPNFSVSPSVFQVPPGDSVKMIVRFAPLTAGSKSGRIVLSHNTITSPDTVSLTGWGLGAGTAVLVAPNLGEGWRLFSLPVTVTCPMIVPYSYAFSGQYIRSDTLANGRGYWTKLRDSVVSFTGFPVIQDTIPLNQGWNLIGSMSIPAPIAGIVSIPDSIVRTSFFGYTGSYAATDTIRPGFGYWVKSGQPGLIILGGAPSPQGAPGIPRIPDTAQRLRVTDALGERMDLFLLAEGEHAAVRDFFELPPPPPGGGFDVRFGTGRMVEFLRPGTGARIPLTITTGAYPVTVEWTGGGTGVLAAGTLSYPLAAAGRLTLHAAGEVLAVGAPAEEDGLPAEFDLGTNYPNPFNPATVIPYALPVQSRVTIRIVDLLGREVRKLLEATLDAGRYTAVWDGRTDAGLPVASGIYFCRLEGQGIPDGARHFVEVGKMVLMK